MIGAQYDSVIDGKAIFDLLNQLKTNVLDTDNITATAVEHCLVACQMPTLNVATPVITPVQNLSQQAFRVYGSNEELYDIFQYPEQSVQEQYGEVFLINKFWCNNEVPGVEQITSPISRSSSHLTQSTTHVPSSTSHATHLKWLIPILSFLLGAAIASVVTLMVVKDKGGNETTEQTPATEVTDTATVNNENPGINLETISSKQSSKNNKLCYQKIKKITCDSR